MGTAKISLSCGVVVIVCVVAMPPNQAENSKNTSALGLGSCLPVQNTSSLHREELLEAGDRIEVVEAFESIDTNPEQFTNGMKGIINVRAPIPLHAIPVVQGNRYANISMILIKKIDDDGE